MQEWEAIAAQARFVCSTPWKKKYETEHLAQRHILMASKAKQKKLRIYKCSCQFFHLTSH